METLVDPYNRLINSLRISLTQECSFNCFFCHREGENNSGGEMTPKEIETIVEVASELGIDKIKLTGGEPLLRHDIVEIVERIAPYFEEVSMTTNGSLMADKASCLRDAGLRRVNISLHTLKPELFKKITYTESIENVLRGIKSAIDCELHPVKLNMVVMKGLNIDEIPDMMGFSEEMGTILQLIEYQALEEGVKNYDNYHFNLGPIEEELKKISESIKERALHRRKQYKIKGGGIVEVVRPMHNSQFCAYCTRLRLTSDGRLKPCLMRDDNLIDVVGLLRNGKPKSALIKAFKEAVEAREPYWRD